MKRIISFPNFTHIAIIKWQELEALKRDIFFSFAVFQITKYTNFLYQEKKYNTWRKK